MHHKRATDRPGLARVIALLLPLSAALTGTLLVMFDADPEAYTTWIALAFGIVLIATLTFQAVTTLGAETNRRAMAELNAVERERRKAVNTATWRRNGRVITTVRYDPDTARYHVKGELVGERWPAETWWREPSRLWMALDDLERSGGVPDRDEGTRTVRARIDLAPVPAVPAGQSTRPLFTNWTQQ